MIRLEVENDRSGDVTQASYDVQIWLPHPDEGFALYDARVEHFRRGRGWAELLREAVDALEAAGIR
ncbi:MAG TPA: hypothetical protein VH834_18215 [Solirubrobacteraceae bacterium]|jgi:hypothetical protein